MHKVSRLINRRRVGKLGSVPASSSGEAELAYSAEALAVFTAADVAPNTARKNLIHTTIEALKTANIWTSLDLLYFLAAQTSGLALINWKNPGTFDATTVNAPTFAINQGYKGNGTSSRLRTNWNPTTNVGNFIRANASMWMWARSMESAGADIGGGTGGGIRAYITAYNGLDFAVYLNNNIATGVGDFTSDHFFGVQRFPGDRLAVWTDAETVGEVEDAPTTLVNKEMWICGGEPDIFSTKQIAFAAWGNGLEGKELAFYNAVNNYMQEVGAV